MTLQLAPERQELYGNLESQAGNTPLHSIRAPRGNCIYAKEEWKNPTGSPFDRLYLFLFKIAEEDNFIVPDITPVIEASTGNAGASFAWCARELGYNNATVMFSEQTKTAGFSPQMSSLTCCCTKKPQALACGVQVQHHNS